ncbi:1884_t:CDS:2 [Cetraspora pellucida]|uniref:1884_t:CDS:1 n=1 Tax=Cetraspora pellucida TaxID=1433469 RepID=A0ACA9KXY3_9GLOM|nr:1884_t:CDS:2 [Cetraspora pellucida]
MLEFLQLDDEFHICYFTRNQDIEDIEDNIVEYLIVVIENNNKDIKKITDKIYKKSEDFLLFQHQYPLHKALLILPDEFTLTKKSAPYLIFSLFFSQNQLQTIVTSTNVYAAIHNAKQGTNQLALVIYMGVFKLPAIKDYWKKDNNYPLHDIVKTMTLFQFQQISDIAVNPTTSTCSGLPTVTFKPGFSNQLKPRPISAIFGKYEFEPCNIILI